jgi:hypothetical protein
MTAGVIDQSQRTASRVVGVAYILSVAIVVIANFGVGGRLMVAGDAAATMHNIASSVGLFRLTIVLDLIYGVGVVVLAAALYVVLRPVSRHLALLAALSRFTFALLWVLVPLALLAVLLLSTDAGVGRSLGAEPSQALVRLLRAGTGNLYYVGLLFWSLAATICSWLWLKSRYVPSALALIGLAGSAWCVFCTVWYLIDPAFANVVNLWWFDSPMVLFEIAVSVWLLVRGLPAGAAA